MTDIIKIKVLNWHKWQRPIDKERRWVAVDIDFYNNPTIELLQRKDPTISHIFLWILTEAGRENSPAFEINQESLNFILKKVCGVSSNRFNIKKRLEELSKAFLIEFETISNEVLNDSESDPKPVLNDFKSPLEHPETRTAVINSINNKRSRSTRTETNTSQSKNKFLPDDFQLADRMFKKIQERNPEHRLPNLESWANEIRLAREQDSRTIDQIWNLFEWAQNDHFWHANILSPSKLRQKWDVLVIQTKRQNVLKPAQRTQTAYSNDKWKDGGGFATL